MKCGCSLRGRLIGDGCEVCNPAKALEYATETIAELKGLVVEAFDVMSSHAARHLRKVDTVNAKFRQFHEDKAGKSAHWLDRAAIYYNEAAQTKDRKP